LTNKNSLKNTSRDLNFEFKIKAKAKQKKQKGQEWTKAKKKGGLNTLGKWKGSIFYTHGWTLTLRVQSFEMSQVFKFLIF